MTDFNLDTSKLPSGWGIKSIYRVEHDEWIAEMRSNTNPYVMGAYGKTAQNALDKAIDAIADNPLDDILQE